MSISKQLEQLAQGSDLSSHAVEDILEKCLNGALSDAEIGGFLSMMRLKGETTDELKAAAKVMQKHAHPLNLSQDLLDIVGTGGDGQSTFNISTASAFVIAGSGINVAKHGNRSVSSKSGSSDVLERLGIRLQLSEAEVKQCLNKSRLVFLYAPHYHPGMKYAAKARKDLGIRTLFNLLGPLLNPARPKHQVIGVYAAHWMPLIKEVLVSLGSERVLVVHSLDGLDEISIAAETKVLEYQHGKSREWLINPAKYGLYHPNLNEVIVGDVDESLKLIEAVLKGQEGAARDIVLLNAAAGIYCAKNDISFEEALSIAKESIDSGKALETLNILQTLSAELNHE